VRGLLSNRELNPAFVHSAFDGFVHRFNVGSDLAILFTLLARSWAEYGSLGAHFVSHLDPESPTFALALDSLIGDWRRWISESQALASLYRKSPSFSYLLTAPSDGSCCKRWCMFLRWMGRDEEGAPARLDPGLWAKNGALAATFPKGRWLRADQLV